MNLVVLLGLRRNLQRGSVQFALPDQGLTPSKERRGRVSDVVPGSGQIQHELHSLVSVSVQ